MINRGQVEELRSSIIGALHERAATNVIPGIAGYQASVDQLAMMFDSPSQNIGGVFSFGRTLTEAARKTPGEVGDQIMAWEGSPEPEGGVLPGEITYPSWDRAVALQRSFLNLLENQYKYAPGVTREQVRAAIAQAQDRLQRLQQAWRGGSGQGNL